MYRFMLTVGLLTLELSGRWQAQQTASPPAGAISGIVIDAVTGQPVAGASVALGCLRQNPDPPLPPRFSTDSKGRFIFANLAAAEDYYLSARGFGYLASVFGDDTPTSVVFFDRVTRIRLATGQWIPDLTIRLWRQPSISGRVTDERGEPIVGAAVRTFSFARTAGHERLVGGSLATTDDRGMYTITDLTPGRYVVSVLSVQSTVLMTTADAPAIRPVGALESAGMSGSSGGVVRGPTVEVDLGHRLAITNFATPPPPSTEQPRAYAAQFYPGARTLDSATPIEIGYGQIQSGIDFHLQPEPALRLRGRTTGLSSPGLLLRLMPMGSEGLGFGSEAATTVIDRDDSFTFLNVPAGNYTLVAQSGVMDASTGGQSAWLPDAPGFQGGVNSFGGWSDAPGVSFIAHYGAGAKVWGRLAVSIGPRSLDDVVLPLRPSPVVSGRMEFAAGVARPAASITVLRLSVEPADGDPLLAVSRITEAKPVEGSFRFSFDVIAGVYLINRVTGYRVMSVTAAGRDVTFTGIDATSGMDVTDVVITLTDKKNPSISGTVAGPEGMRSAVLAFPADGKRWSDYGWSARSFEVASVGPDGHFSLTSLPAGEYLIAVIDASDFDRWAGPKFLEAARTTAARITVDWGETRTLTLSRPRDPR